MVRKKKIPNFARYQNLEFYFSDLNIKKTVYLVLLSGHFDELSDRAIVAAFCGR